MSPLVARYQEITEREVDALRGVSASTAAQRYDGRARELETQARRGFVEWGLICMEVAERSLWAELGDPETGVVYPSFDAWLASVAAVSRSTAYNAMATLKRLRAVPINEVRAMPRCNAVTLAQLSTAVQRRPEILAAAQSLSEEQFIAKIQAEHPDQHIESRRKILAAPTASARTKIDQAIGLCMQIEECGREEALEAICAFYWEEHAGEQYLAVGAA